MQSIGYPVPILLRRRLWYGTIGAFLFMVASIIEGCLREGYDSWQQAVSALSLGERGWVQMTLFIFFGIIIVTTVPAWRRILAGGKGAKAFPVLMMFSGLSIIICGIIPQDPAPGYDPENLQLSKPSLPGLLHLLFAAIGALSSISALVVISCRFKGHRQWKGWRVYTLCMAALMTICVTIYGVWSTQATGYAGLFERLGIMTVPIWGLIFLIALSKGKSFMAT